MVELGLEEEPSDQRKDWEQSYKDEKFRVSGRGSGAGVAGVEGV